MSTAQPPSEPSVPPLPEQPSRDRELLTFLREESEANRKSLREEADANRKLLNDTLKIAAIPLSVIIAVAGFFGWRSLSDLKESVQNEAKQETQAEITRMQQEIREKLKAQFETPQLKQMVKEAATAQTGQVLRPLIEREVSSDVSRGVKAQQPTIHSTIVSETHKEVDALRPTIDSIVNTRVNATVDQSVDKEINSKVQPVLNQLQQSQQIADLEMRAQAGDGAAFDQMVAVATNDATPEPLRGSMLSAARDILQKHNGIHNGRRWLVPVTTEQMLKYLSDADSFNRQAALDNLQVDVLRQHLDELFKVMTTDPNLSVREAGFIRFNQLMIAPTEKDHIESLDTYHAFQYYTAHRQEMIEGKKSEPGSPAGPH